MSTPDNQPDGVEGSGVSSEAIERRPGIGAVDTDAIQLIQQPELSEAAGKIGAVEAPAVPIGSPQRLADSPTFRAMEDRLSESARIASINDRRSLHHLEQELTIVLSSFARTHRLSSLLIASADGLVIARSEKSKQESVLAALAALCDGVCARVRRESVLTSVDEITLRARDGARLTIRDFTGLEEPFLLIASSSTAIPRSITDEVIRACGALLQRFFSPLSEPAFDAPAQARASIWRRAAQQLLASLRTSTLFD